MITTKLLKWMAEKMSPCAKAERALVIPHPGHSNPNRFLTKQRLCPASINEVGTVTKTIGTKMKSNNRRIRMSPPSSF